MDAPDNSRGEQRSVAVLMTMLKGIRSEIGGLARNVSDMKKPTTSRRRSSMVEVSRALQA